MRTGPVPLPHARVGALTGFLEMVAERAGTVDLHRLAGDLHLQVRELLPLVDAAALLGLATVHEGDAILSASGPRPRPGASPGAQGSLPARAAGTHDAGDDHPRGPRGKGQSPPVGIVFLGLLEQHFSGVEARRQLDTAIDWGRYAEAFGFESDTKELFLEAAEQTL